MSFATKTDLVGLAREGLELKANAQNASNSLLEIPGSDGSVIGDIITGHVKAPNCDYAVTKRITLAGLSLGHCYNAPYALASLTVNTGAGTEPTVQASTVEIEQNATQSICTYAIDDISLSPAHHASTFGALTYTESASLVLNSSTFTASATITPATINNEPVASDATGGRQTVNVTFWSASEQ